MKTKKANAIAEGVIILVVLFVFGFISIIGFNIFSDVNDEIQADNNLNNESKAISDDLHTRYPSLFDGLFSFLVIGLWISALIFSFFVDTHPIFLVLTIILMIFILVLAAYLGNAWLDITDSTELTAASVSFPMMTFVFNHLLETVMVMVFSIAMALFAKSKTG